MVRETAHLFLVLLRAFEQQVEAVPEVKGQRQLHKAAVFGTPPLFDAEVFDDLVIAHAVGEDIGGI